MKLNEPYTVNNGYTFTIYYMGNGHRVFGPFPSATQAHFHAERFCCCKFLLSGKAEPIIGRKYMAETNSLDITHVVFDVLEKVDLFEAVETL